MDAPNRPPLKAVQEDDPLADAAKAEIEALWRSGQANEWSEPSIDALFNAIKRWLDHPELLNPASVGLLRVTVLNELTWLIPEPIVGERAWELIKDFAAGLARNDPHGLRESLRIATLELAAGPPEDPDALRMLFTLAEAEDTRWAVFAAYEMFPWRLRHHARKYSNGLVTDDDCDAWFEEQCLENDEILMDRSIGEQVGVANPEPGLEVTRSALTPSSRGSCWRARCWPG